MPRPKKYDSLHGSQAAYRQTAKGQATEQRYESSEKGKQRKREWWHRHKPKTDKRQEFIDTYGEIEAALSLLAQQEQLVMTRLYGLDGNKPMLQKLIASELGVSQQRIGQIKKKALDKLNNH